MSTEQPVLSITSLPGKLPTGARQITTEGATIDRLSSVFQAVPSLLTSGEVARGGYMKVVIDGPLVKATDGNGDRAFTLGSKGIRK